MKWYKHDPAAFLEGVIGLTAEERGFYITVIDLLYARDGYNVTDELVCSAMGCRADRWRRVKARLIACGKVQEKDGLISVERAQNEISTGVLRGFARVRSAKINDLAGDRARATSEPDLFTSYVEAEGESEKRKRDHSARSLASALPSGALTREPEVSASLVAVIQAKGWLGRAA